MKFVIQRVNHAKVSIDERTAGEIGQGFLVLVGVGRGDTRELADRYIKKMLGLRIFQDRDGKTNLSLKDVDGQLLIVSQFTLYANCKKGNRPSFIESGSPEDAQMLYDYIVDSCKKEIPVVQTGEFGAYMKVSLENDGPFTILLDEHLFS